MIKELRKELDVTVVVCSKNSIASIEACIVSILRNKPSNLFLVDANSNDGTQEVATRLGVKIIDGYGRGLTADRQLGIEKSKTEFTFFIDSDHIIPENYLSRMLEIIQRDKYTLVQSQLAIYEPKGLLNLGESAYYELVHNNPREKIIPGVAPAVFQTLKLKKGSELEMEDGLTPTIDDTSWASKAVIKGAKIGINGPVVHQLHLSGFRNYYRKFKWYGIGDGEFCAINRSLAFRHYYHLFIRYPIVYVVRAIIIGKSRAVPFLVMQGITRGYWCAVTHIRLKVGKL